jgi:hypothetical protein
MTRWVAGDHWHRNGVSRGAPCRAGRSRPGILCLPPPPPGRGPPYVCKDSRATAACPVRGEVLVQSLSVSCPSSMSHSCSSPSPPGRGPSPPQAPGTRRPGARWRACRQRLDSQPCPTAPPCISSSILSSSPLAPSRASPPPRPPPAPRLPARRHPAYVTLRSETIIKSYTSNNNNAARGPPRRRTKPAFLPHMSRGNSRRLRVAPTTSTTTTVPASLPAFDSRN